MAAENKSNSMIGSSSKEIIRPVSYTGPLMPRGDSVSQQSILIPDISTYFQTFIDSIFKKTKEEALPEVKQVVAEGKGVLEKTDTTEFSEKTKAYTDMERELHMKQDPYKRLFYDQCILEGCDPESCYKKYVLEMS
jgi:hypothetical protein